ncbi:MAG TPA: tripartite tricarboxylate transporter permease [Acidimicrobiales bacterium]|nr:tripartite tricarboxylate transporter permease [Acidimicrobiales bacterium]
MTYLHASLTGLNSIISLATLAGLSIGIVWGMLISFMPGVGGNVALVLLLPFMYKLSLPVALALLLGTHIATYFGGSITSITLDIPASAKSLPLCWDGYPLACSGKGAYALGASASASGIGGVCGAVALTVGIPVMRSLLDYLGPPEVLLLALLGAILIAILSSGNLTKGLLAFGVGIILSWVGQDPITGVDRLTFGSLYLSSGVPVADVAIGLFAVVQVMRLIAEPDRFRRGVRRPEQSAQVARARAGLRPNLGDLRGTRTSLHGLGAVLRHWKLELYMSTFGVLTGTVPGFGAPVAAVAAYGQAAQYSKSDVEFGLGAIEGVIAPQATESAAEGGGMLPLLSLGIPTHEQQAILLAAFVTLGIAPGPAMLSNHLPTVFSIIWLIVGASLAMMLIGLVFAKQFAKLTTIPKTTLIPLVLTVSVVGSFAVNGSFGDVVTTGVIGILGYFFWKFNYSRINLIIGLVLGPIIESNLHISTTLYGDGFMFKRPLAGAIFAAILLTIATWGVRVAKQGRRTADVPGDVPGDVPAGASRARGRGIASFKPRADGPTVAAVLLLVGFVVVALIARTYGSLTGGDLLLVSGVGAALALANLVRLVVHGQVEELGVGERLRSSGKGPVGRALKAPELVLVGTAPGHGEAAPSGSAADEPAAAATGGAVATGVELEVVETPGAPEPLEDTTAPARHAVIRAVATVGTFFLLAYLVGIVPATGLGFGLYGLVVRRKSIVYCAAVTVAVGMAVWLLFHFLINEYAPYVGFVHFLPS